MYSEDKIIGDHQDIANGVLLNNGQPMEEGAAEDSTLSGGAASSSDSSGEYVVEKTIEPEAAESSAYDKISAANAENEANASNQQETASEQLSFFESDPYDQSLPNEDAEQVDYAAYARKLQDDETLSRQAQAAAREEQLPKHRREKSNLAEFLEIVIIAIVLAAIIRIFLFEPFYIPSSSMENTLQIGDRIIVNKLVYDFKDPQRGDIIVFHYPLDPSNDFVKRIVGISGDIIEVHDGHLYRNNEELSEEYIAESYINGSYGPVQVPEGYYFCMGDNRNNSDDSRSWGFLAEDLIIGRTDVIYWPLDRLQLVD